MKNLYPDPFPEPSIENNTASWVCGRAEYEAFRHQQLIREKNNAKLKVGYPGEFMTPHAVMHFRAQLPAGNFPVECIGTPAITEIRNAAPGVFEFTLSVPDIQQDIPCFRCDEKFSWESSFDGIEWHKAAVIPGSDIPPHKTRLPEFLLTPEKRDDGIFDTGREIYGFVYIRKAPEARLFVGESIPEVKNRDPEDFEQRLDLVTLDDGTLRSAVPLAFRYIELEQGESAEVEVGAIYTPLALKKRFVCDDDELNTIWNTSVYTLHLCTFYFLIDGVKRDRLPWAGDLAVSLLSMTESFCDPAPIRDTLTILGSAGIRNEDINGIADYSLWYLICIDLYMKHFDDQEFLQREYFRVTETAEIILARRQPDSLLPVEGMVLIDWADGNKNCALQVMLYIGLKALSDLGRRMNDSANAEKWSQLAAELKVKIRNDFFNADTGLFRCSPGKDEYLRHQNFLAVCGDITTPEESRVIAQHLLKDELPQVGTPYMKSFEIYAIIHAGLKAEAVREIRSYWGGMVNAGATTFFEAYGKGKHGTGIYDFYNRPYGLSLCHAWGSAPAFLLPLAESSSSDLL